MTSSGKCQPIGRKITLVPNNIMSIQIVESGGYDIHNIDRRR